MSTIVVRDAIMMDDAARKPRGAGFIKAHDPALRCLHVFFPRKNPGTDYTVNHVGGKMGFHRGLWPFLFGFFVEPYLEHAVLTRRSKFEPFFSRQEKESPTN